jgi:hypothetical protein
MADASRRDLERELEAANTYLEGAVIEALRARKSLLDPKRKDELKAEIWQRRTKVIELERDHVGEQLMKARHAADRAATREDHDEYLQASRQLARLRIRYLNAVDLLEKLRADGPDSSARLLGGS